MVRRPPAAVLLLCGLATLTLVAGCRPSSRERARAEFIEQLTTEGGVPADLAECVADGFLGSRSTEEMQAFFERPELTAEEADEFARLAEECTTPPTP